MKAEVLTCTCFLSDQLHVPHPPPHHAPTPPVKQERRKREAKAKADEAASELHNIDNIDKDSEKHYILSVSTVKDPEIIRKPTLKSLL